MVSETYKESGWDWEGELSSNQYMGDVQRKIIDDLHTSGHERFKLDQAFVRKYEPVVPPFGFNGFGEATYMRTYSRIKEDGFNERWHDTVERVVEGTYNMQKRWINSQGLEWSDHKAQESAQEMFDRMYYMKFLPPGRGLWAMGSEITEERGLYAALNNCAFVSTEDLKDDKSKPFRFLMDMSMLGVGVGFDTKGAGSMIIPGYDKRRTAENFIIPDTREGWVEATGRLIDSYFLKIAPIKMDYSNLRGEGELIGGFGGKSSGARPLIEMHNELEEILDNNARRPITARTIVDIQNVIGKCVVAGNVRRTAEIAFGEPGDEEFLDLKNYKVHPERKDYGWTSNNSILAELGMDYSEIAERIRINGEPGLAWLDNMREYSRMGHPPDHKDMKVKGGNPCLEQSLESYELCNLVETFPNHHESKDDFLRTLKFAYMYAKTVTLGRTHWEETNRVLLRNRRIGCSVSGVQQFLGKNGIGELREWLDDGYNEIEKYDGIYSDWLVTPKSIKRTSIKPSGTVSSVAGATPGMHWPNSEYFIRRMRISKQSELVDPIREAGYPVEDDVADSSSYVVEFPVHVGRGLRSEEHVSMWEQLEMAAFMQEHWADNQVSSTIKFNPGLNNEEFIELVELREKPRKKKGDLEKIANLSGKAARSEGHDIVRALDHFQWKLKGISMLPKEDNVYEQLPFETITSEDYYERLKNIKEVDYGSVRNSKAVGEKFCTTDACEINQVPIED